MVILYLPSVGLKSSRLRRSMITCYKCFIVRCSWTLIIVQLTQQMCALENKPKYLLYEQ